jgi:hypothetical protein
MFWILGGPLRSLISRELGSLLMRPHRIHLLVVAVLGCAIACSTPPADEGSPSSGGAGQGGASAATGGTAVGGSGAGTPVGGGGAGGTAGGVTTGGTAGGGSGNGGFGVGGSGAGAPSGGGLGGGNAGSSGSSTGGAGSPAGASGGGRAAGGNAGSPAGAGGRAAGGGAGTGGTNPSCSTRTGGALVDFRICNQILRLWITNGAFITEALRLRSSGGTRIACFPGLLDGRDCDPAYTWNADPTRAYWSDFELETYFACPADVEGDKSEWIEQVSQFCGQITTVTAVADRR